MSGNVQCPIHGEHGALADGKCWYCVQEGKVPPDPPAPVEPPPAA